MELLFEYDLFALTLLNQTKILGAQFQPTIYCTNLTKSKFHKYLIILRCHIIWSIKILNYYLRSFIQVNSQINVWRNSTDVYGRWLAEVYTVGTNINLNKRLLQDGISSNLFMLYISKLKQFKKKFSFHK
jgi:hypothetical protein